MASTSPTNNDSSVDTTTARLQANLSKRLQLVTANIPFQCSKRCDETLPDWSTIFDFIIEELSKSGYILTSGVEEFHNLNIGLKVATLTKDLLEIPFNEQDHLNQNKVCGCGGKNADSADALKLVGNDLFKEGQYFLAIKFYSVAMVICPAGVNLAVLHANRSAAAARVDQFENALEDIDLAMKMQYPREKQGKLLLRKADSLLKLGRSVELTEFLVSITSMAEPPVFSADEQIRLEKLKSLALSPLNAKAFKNTNLGKYLNVADVIETLSSMGRFCVGNKFPWLSAKVKLFRDPESQKFRIVASEKIKAGEILALVKPFAVVPMDENNKSRKNSVERCHHCTATIYRSAAYIENPDLLILEETMMKSSNSPTNSSTSSSLRMNNPVNCSLCSAVLFCSDDCATEAWKTYHQFECGHLSILRSLGADAQLALRVLYSSGTVDRSQKLVSEAENSTNNLFTVIKAQFSGVPPLCARLDELDDDYRRLFYSPTMTDNMKNKYRSMIVTRLLQNLCVSSSFFQTAQDCFIGGKMLVYQYSQVKRNFVVVGRRNYRSLSLADAYDRFQVATGLATIVEPAAEENQANVHLQVLNPLEIVRSNILLLTAKRSLEKGEKLSMDLSSGHFDTSAQAPVIDTELLGRP